MNKHSGTGNLRNDILKSKEFDDYLLGVSYNLVRLIIALVGLFNIVLIIADYMNIDNVSGRMTAVVLRSTFVAAVIVLLIWVKRIKPFKLLALVVTLYELAAVALFLYVFSVYSTPDFLIQLLGLIIIVLVIFIVPNLWCNMIGVSLALSAGFFTFAYFSPASTSPQHFFIAAVYVLLEILICAGFALYYRRFKQGEFLARKELLRIYSTDPLTKVGNRVMLRSEAKRWMEFCSRHGLDLSLVLIDIDDMKKINDEYGHLVGDIILYETAQIMSSQMRINDVCVRWGGDEFVLLLPNTDANQARKLSERIQNAFLNQDIAENLRITCSFGIASMHKGDSLDLLVQQADSSMYASKKQGKNAIHTSGDKPEKSMAAKA